MSLRTGQRRERPIGRGRRWVAALLSTVTVLCLPAGALAAPTARVHPDIVGGHTASNPQFPWQVYLLASNPGAACGGSILDATHVLTAAHCIIPPGTTVARTPADFKVYAGINNVRQPAPGYQVVGVSSLRVHPYYNTTTFADDVAVLTLARPLAFNSSVRPISLTTTTPAAGTAVTISGYGQEQPSPAPGSASLVNGSLNWTAQTLLSEDDPACQGRVGPNSAVVLCAYSPTSSPCFGDSGGPLVAGNPAVEIGVFSYLGANNPACSNAPTQYTNVAAPEVRDFIEGSSAPPVAPRPATEPQTFGVLPAVDDSPLTCRPGTWSGSPSISYSFETTGATLADPLQAGPSSTFTPTAAQIGQRLSCTVIATNAGGTAVTRFDQANPIVADTTPPQSEVLARRCAHRSCSVKVRAVDSNSLGPVTVQASLGYTTSTTHCVRVRRHHHRKRRCTTRRVRHAVAAAVANTAPYTYQVTTRNMPFGSSHLTVSAIDAAGNRQTKATVVRLFIRRPKKHPAHHHPKKKHHHKKHR